MSVLWVTCGRVTQKQKALSWVLLSGSVLTNIFKWGGGGGSLRPFKGSPRRRASRGPLAHMITRLITM